MIDYSLFPLLITSLVCSAMFSGVEIAFVSANKLQIELASKKGAFSGAILSKFVGQPSRFIGTTLVGNTIALVAYGIFMASLLDPVLIAYLPEIFNNEATILVLQTIISTIIVLITAEFTPKSFFLINPNWLLSIFALPMLLFYYLLFPIVFTVVSLSRLIITHVFRLEYNEDKPVFGLTDLNNYIQTTLLNSNPENKVELNHNLFNNALEFKTIRVRECMIPRTEIAAVDVADDIETLRNTFSNSGHSKIVIYKDSIDEVIGYCHSMEMFKKPKNVANILSPIIIVPEAMLANELLIQFITERKSIALVVDEFGGTSGIVSMEDIIEEIFGEIQDEHDDEDWVEQQIDANTYKISARHEIDYLNEKYNWDIPAGDYDTLGGYILSITENIPSINDIVEAPPFIFTILSMEDTRIDNVKLTILPVSKSEG